MRSAITPVLLSGGAGTRLWPLSRNGRPKQFLTFSGEDSLYQMTLRRSALVSENAPPIVVCNESHRFVVAEQAKERGALLRSIILEPEGRNTAPAVALAAMHLLQEGTDSLMLIQPCDHMIGNLQEFANSVENGRQAAEQGAIVTFGIVPDAPHTGYGYIQGGAHVDKGTRKIERFVEKPTEALAQEFLNTGGYYWNSGIFLVRASVYLAQLANMAPDIVKHCQLSFDRRKADIDFCRIGIEEFLDCRADSIDYAVMEQTDLGMVVAMNAGWSDVGSWESLWKELPKDGGNNAVRGDVVAIESNDNLVYSSGKLVALLGVQRLAVVETPDAILVCALNGAQGIKELVEELRYSKRKEVDNHRVVHRPWGCYDSVDAGARYQVKRITVKPGEKLSVQMHHHRAEHWVVVSGTAKVAIGDQVKLVTENESVYIPVGVVHSLENPGRIPLHLIEVQSGSYLSEDDIVRFEDRYGRVC